MDHDRDPAMTSSEEQLTVDTVWRPAERVWVRRRVVEEEVMVAVTVRRGGVQNGRGAAPRVFPPRRGGGGARGGAGMGLPEGRAGGGGGGGAPPGVPGPPRG